MQKRVISRFSDLSAQVVLALITQCVLVSEGMKRTALIRTIREGAQAAGLDVELARNDGDHEGWVIDGLGFSVPRHRELNELTARSILKRLEPKLGKEWWR